MVRLTDLRCYSCTCTCDFLLLVDNLPRLCNVCLWHCDPTFPKQGSVPFQIDFRLYRRDYNSCIFRMKSILLPSCDNHNQHNSCSSVSVLKDQFLKRLERSLRSLFEAVILAMGRYLGFEL